MSDPLAGPEGSHPPRNTTRRPYTPEQRLALIQAADAWQGRQKDFCAQVGVGETALIAWRKVYRARGAAGLQAGLWVGNRVAVRRGPYRPAQRQQAVETYRQSGQPLDTFARLWQITPRILRHWVRVYEQAGAPGLHAIRAGSPPGRRLPAAVTETILATKRRFLDFGLQRLHDVLRRFHGVAVSPGSIRKTVQAAGLPPGGLPRRRRRGPRRIRRFERSRPGALWQSDITSLVLPRTRQRLYLVAFLDDHSRFVVAWGLHVTMRTAQVLEVLLEGIGRFGKPVEVLTDQGPQYFAWRGTSEFQQVLKREGLRHVVARSHHPQTVGKCERFWKTVQTEFWARVQPTDLADARRRLAHFIAHYNFFRPHQGIDGLVPADRFFGAESAVRQSLEATLHRRELQVALGESPRQPVYLTGQIGDTPISLVGERGTLVIQTPDGIRRELSYDGLGMAQAQRKEADHDTDRDAHDGDPTQPRAGAGAQPDDGGGRPAAPPAADEPVQPGPAADPDSGRVAGRDDGGTPAGAPDRDAPAGILAGPPLPGGDRPGVEPAADPDHATLPDGPGRDDDGPAAAAHELPEGPPAAPAGGESSPPEETDGGAGAGEPTAPGPGDPPTGSAVEPGVGHAAGR